MAVLDELIDPDFAHRKHYSRSTYKDGCHGPLCLKSERDKAARRYATLNPEKKSRARRPEDVERDEYLDAVIKAFGLLSEEQALLLA